MEKNMMQLAGVVIPKSMIKEVLEVCEVGLDGCNKLLAEYNKKTGYPGFKWFLLGSVFGTEVSYPKDEPRCPLPEIQSVITYVMAKIEIPEAMQMGRELYKKIVNAAEDLDLVVDVESYGHNTQYKLLLYISLKNGSHQYDYDTGNVTWGTTSFSMDVFFDNIDISKLPAIKKTLLIEEEKKLT